MTETLQDKVNRGVALLDERYPEWRNHVDPNRLHMNHVIHHPYNDGGCLLAQLNYNNVVGQRYEGWDGLEYGSYSNALAVLFADQDDMNNVYRMSSNYGFSLGSSTGNWAELKALWQNAI